MLFLYVALQRCYRIIISAPEPPPLPPMISPGQLPGQLPPREKKPPKKQQGNGPVPGAAKLGIVIGDDTIKAHKGKLRSVATNAL